MEAADYEAWYHTPRGRWIGDTEFALLLRLLPPVAGASLLDTGSGTGYFSRRFAAAGLRVTGLDPDWPALLMARKQAPATARVQGRAQALPFADAGFDYCCAITSLCFIEEPERALQEMWRVAGRGVLLGLLNRHSLLYRQKRGRGGYRGARWDTLTDVHCWIETLSPAPARIRAASAVFLPDAGPVARLLERLLPASLPWGAFLAVYIEKPRPGS